MQNKQTVIGKWFCGQKEVSHTWQSKIGKTSLGFFFPSTDQFLWACTHCSLLFLAERCRVFCCCCPSASRVNVLCSLRCFSAHHNYKGWLYIVSPEYWLYKYSLCKTRCLDKMQNKMLANVAIYCISTKMNMSLLRSSRVMQYTTFPKTTIKWQ